MIRKFYVTKYHEPEIDISPILDTNIPGLHRAGHPKALTIYQWACMEFTVYWEETPDEWGSWDQWIHNSVWERWHLRGFRKLLNSLVHCHYKQDSSTVPSRARHCQLVACVKGHTQFCLVFPSLLGVWFEAHENHTFYAQWTKKIPRKNSFDSLEQRSPVTS